MYTYTYIHIYIKEEVLKTGHLNNSFIFSDRKNTLNEICLISRRTSEDVMILIVCQDKDISIANFFK